MSWGTGGPRAPEQGRRRTAPASDGSTPGLDGFSRDETLPFTRRRPGPSLYTLTRGVGQLTSGGLGSGQQFPISMAAALLMTIPTAIVFVVFQRYFTQGANAGADKG